MWPETASPKSAWENKFAQFLAEEAKAVEKKTTKEVEDIQAHNYDYKDKSNLDNQIGQEVLNGLYFEGRENPDFVIACVGGGSNAAGAFYHFLDETAVELIAVEAKTLGETTWTVFFTLTFLFFTKGNKSLLELNIK